MATKSTEELIAYYGLHRVVEPSGVGLQGALKINPLAITSAQPSSEMVLNVSLLELDSTSLRQIHHQAQQDAPADIASTMATTIAAIVKQRGKMHNPVTGSGGVMVARLAEAPPRAHPQHQQLLEAYQKNLRVIPLCSLTSIPLELSAVGTPDIVRCQVPVTGTARLAPSVRIAILPEDEQLMPTTIALQCIDISRLLPQLSKILPQLPKNPTIAVLGSFILLLFLIFLLSNYRY